jgi:hypothetical protein
VNSRVVDSITHYLTVFNSAVPVPPKLSLNLHLLTLTGSVAVAPFIVGDEMFVDGVASAQQRFVPADGWKQITRRLARNPRQFLGYENHLFRVYATPGSVYLLAAPVIVPGHLPMAPNEYYGIVPSLEAWR